jgi:hypothetical protein
MLRIILLDFMLRAFVAPQGFAPDSSLREGFLLAADPMGETRGIIGIIPALGFSSGDDPAY